MAGHQGRRDGLNKRKAQRPRLRIRTLQEGEESGNGE